MKRTMYQKIWDAHVVQGRKGEIPLLYIDRHLLHEVTSPQAFSGLRLKGRKVRRPASCLATMDHAVPTINRELPIADPFAARQVEALAENCSQSGIRLFDLAAEGQGVIHIIAPEMGFTQPGMTLVCGDSHTATHGAFGALAFGIGTSEVEHVLATQTLRQKQARTLLVTIDGTLPEESTAKDMALAVIGSLGTAGGTGFVIEFAGEAVCALSMEGRMTLCNMAIEAGARAGMVAPDEKTFAYLSDKPDAPKGAARLAALEYWRTLPTDAGAKFDRTLSLDAGTIHPMVTWGTSPEQVVSVTDRVPAPSDFDEESRRNACEKALAYMGLTPGTPITEIPLTHVFIGSCTNGRIEDLREAARFLSGRKVHPEVTVLVVAGSGRVKRQAEAEGLHTVFLEAGCQWREPGCSMCLAMNDDVLPPFARCASTSNRNFEGRQGKDARTHLVSPAMAAAAAVAGRLVDIRCLRCAPES